MYHKARLGVREAVSLATFYIVISLCMVPTPSLIAVELSEVTFRPRLGANDCSTANTVTKWRNKVQT